MEDAIRRNNKRDIRKFSVEDDIAAGKLIDLKKRVKDTEAEVN